jgi:hypothetical protein
MKSRQDHCQSVGRPGYEMSDERPKCDSMSVEEATVSNMWEIGTIL